MHFARAEQMMLPRSSLENIVSDKVVDVAVGVLIREDGRMLLGSRPEGKPYAGYWEFPGGKLEKNETVHQALARELEEELGIALADSTPWFVKEHVYPHAHVRLHFRRSHDFVGTPVPKEGQECGFYAANERTPGLMLPVDQAIVNRVELPEVFEESSDLLTLSRNALQATIVRDRSYRWVGARAETMDDVLKAVAMDYDFVIVPPEAFDGLLVNGEPRIPTYVDGAPAADLAFWQAKGAQGVKPVM